MAIDHIIPDLDRKGLREFGLTTGAAIVVIFGLFFPWMLELDWPLWPMPWPMPTNSKARMRSCPVRLEVSSGWLRLQS